MATTTTRTLSGRCVEFCDQEECQNSLQEWIALATQWRDYAESIKQNATKWETRAMDWREKARALCCDNKQLQQELADTRPKAEPRNKYQESGTETRMDVYRNYMMRLHSETTKSTQRAENWRQLQQFIVRERTCYREVSERCGLSNEEQHKSVGSETEDECNECKSLQAKVAGSYR